MELVARRRNRNVKERVYFCEILVSTMTQDTSPRTEGSGDENTDLSSSRRTRRNTSRRDPRIPNLFGLTARISGFLEISLSLSLSVFVGVWEKTLNRTSDFDNCLRETWEKRGAKRRACQRRTRIFRHLTPLVNDEASDATYFDRVKIEGINRSIVKEGPPRLHSSKIIWHSSCRSNEAPPCDPMTFPNFIIIPSLRNLSFFFLRRSRFLTKLILDPQLDLRCSSNQLISLPHL